MMKYARVVNPDTKLCEVALGDNNAFYEAIGMTMQDVEEGYNGWYLAGYAPEQPKEEKAEEIRQLRNLYLTESDKYMLEDYPLTAEERELCRQYRRYLRDISLLENFPDITLMSFSEWLSKAVKE